MKISSNMRNRVLGVLLMLALLAAFVPQPAQAASCQANYVVLSGDTTPKIAHSYGMAWRKIALANDLVIGQKPKVGSTLCIPTVNSSSSGSAANPNAVISVNIVNGRVFINTNKLSADSVFLIKVRDVGTGVGGWSKLGRLRLSKNTSEQNAFSLPNDFNGIPIVSVCLKDMTTDDLFCRSAVNP
jgi:hypothetical protein